MNARNFLHKQFSLSAFSFVCYAQMMLPLLPLHTTSIRFSFPFLTSRTILVHMYIHMFVTTMTGIIKCAISLIGDHIYSIVYKYICLTRQTVYMVHFTHFFLINIRQYRVELLKYMTYHIKVVKQRQALISVIQAMFMTSAVFFFSSSLGVSVLYWTRK